MSTKLRKIIKSNDTFYNDNILIICNKYVIHKKYVYKKVIISP